LPFSVTGGSVRRKDVAGERAAIFTTLAGKPVSVRYVQAAVKRYTARAGITKSVPPHALRHSFATDLYRETKDIRLTQKALGHANLATTQIYTHLVDEDLEAALKSFRNVPVGGSGDLDNGLPSC
jgi:integrase/recombinase XerD